MARRWAVTAWASSRRVAAATSARRSSAGTWAPEGSAVKRQPGRASAASSRTSSTVTGFITVPQFRRASRPREAAAEKSHTPRRRALPGRMPAAAQLTVVVQARRAIAAHASGVDSLRPNTPMMTQAMRRARPKYTALRLSDQYLKTFRESKRDWKEAAMLSLSAPPGRPAHEIGRQPQPRRQNAAGGGQHHTADARPGVINEPPKDEIHRPDKGGQGPAPRVGQGQQQKHHPEEGKLFPVLRL